VKNPVVIPVTTQNYDWLPQVQTAISSNSKRHIILVAQDEPLSGIVGLVNCIRKEPGSDLVRLETSYSTLFTISEVYIMC
jgi:fatty acid synthase